nr:hypothetical protein Iba_chr04aCG21650 [Ipomoea batatas]
MPLYITSCSIHSVNVLNHLLIRLVLRPDKLSLSNKVRVNYLNICRRHTSLGCKALNFPSHLISYAAKSELTINDIKNAKIVGSSLYSIPVNVFFLVSTVCSRRSERKIKGLRA